MWTQVLMCVQQMLFPHQALAPAPKNIKVILIFNFNFYVYGRLVCVCLVFSRLEEHVWSPGVIGSCEQPYWGWELNTGPLQKQTRVASAPNLWVISLDP